MTAFKDPGFHRMEVTFRLNNLQVDGGPNEPDMLIHDYATGHFMRLPEESVRALVPAIERFLREAQELREAPK